MLRHRRGFVLLVVTIVLILLSLAAWAYTNKMVIEKDATLMYARDVEARMSAESAVGDRDRQIAAGDHVAATAYRSVGR